MSKSLLCRLGYHHFGPWQEVQIASKHTESGFSPRRYVYRKRECTRCHLEHLDYSPQIGMLVTPPEVR